MPVGTDVTQAPAGTVNAIVCDDAASGPLLAAVTT